jgi:hypothetical protein
MRATCRAHHHLTAARPCITFRNMLIFHSEGLLAPWRTSKLQDHPLKAVREPLFNIFTANLHLMNAQRSDDKEPT